ncbi:TetR/AcrR family transcriptional regulator [Plantactinospora sp. WMMC1484]|uniref:TetR/AcrR family transcriptional regulator n=1 Tax=Plantactinospora sp. WMMC1484 TaxID=3404122 RepID=UPI003BF5CC7D
MLEAAGKLFDAADDPAQVSADDIALAAGVGKGTLFRGFGSRSGLVLALFERRAEELLHATTAHDDTLAPHERAVAILLLLIEFKRDNRVVAAAVEASDGNPYHQTPYTKWHALLTDLITQARGPQSADFLAHTLLAAIRSDLIAHLATWPAERLEHGIRTLVTSVFGAEPTSNGTGRHSPRQSSHPSSP